MQTVRIGTRGSKLALYQANRVKEELEIYFPEIVFEITIIKTKGDKILDVPLSKIGDKGLFTKELEVAMFDDEIDMAVHSLKDLPTTFPDGVKLGAVLKRGDVRDAVISSNNRKLSDLTPHDIIATSSLRRKAQLLRINKNFKIIEIRGNVNTRIRKMQEGYCDVMVMAAAGLQRLGMDEFITDLIDPNIIIPACGQGAIAIEIKDNNPFIENILSKVNDEETMITTAAERAFLKNLEGGCQIPVGSYSYIKDKIFHFTGFISSIGGSKYLNESAIVPVDQAIETATSIAKKLFDTGGKDILEAIRRYNIPDVNEKSSIKDKVIISTRAVEPGDALPDILSSHGARLISLPVIEIIPSPLSEADKELLNTIDTLDWIFFTSKNGVANFFKHLLDIKGSTELPSSVKKAVIGGKTALELDYYGYAPDFISSGNTSEDFLKQFYNDCRPQNKNILLSLGNLADDALMNSLSKENNVKRINVYQTIKPKTADLSILDLIRQNKYDLIVFTSPSTFYNFCSFYDPSDIKLLKIASIGATTTTAIENAGVKPLLTARQSNVEGLSEEILTYYKNFSSL